MEPIDRFWYFANERYRLFENRQITGMSVPSPDPILNDNRFTNTFRVTDRVSQRLLHIQQEGPQDPASLILRTILFKVFNKESTWDAIVENTGQPSVDNWDPAAVQAVLDDRVAAGEKIFTGSYMMVNPLTAGWVKHHYYIDMIGTLLGDHHRNRILESRSLADLTGRLWEIEGIGAFLAYQYAIDLNYTSLFDFSEDDYVLVGHGAKRGLKRLFGNSRMAEARVMELTLDRGDRGPKLMGSREMHLIDTQNVLCEYDKYMRVLEPDGTRRAKQRYRPDPRPLPELVWPEGWNL